MEVDEFDITRFVTERILFLLSHHGAFVIWGPRTTKSGIAAASLVVEIVNTPLSSKVAVIVSVNSQVCPQLNTEKRKKQNIKKNNSFHFPYNFTINVSFWPGSLYETGGSDRLDKF